MEKKLSSLRKRDLNVAGLPQRRRGTSPKYKSSHFPEKANTGLFQEQVICPTFLENLLSHFPENCCCQSFARNMSTTKQGGYILGLVVKIFSPAFAPQK